MKKLFSLLLVLALCAGMGVPALAAGFSDVPAGHYAAGAIESCVARGIVSGYADGTFRPREGLTRAQFCVMLARAFYPEQAAGENQGAPWFASGVLALKNAGVLKGAAFEDYAENENIMNQQATRFDMAQLIVNILSSKGFAPAEEQKEEARRSIADKQGIPEKYRDAVEAVYALGIITGYPDGSFGGWNTMNRGQGCVVIYRMAEYVPASSAPGLEPAPPAAPEQPEAPEAPAAKTLTNGSPVSEANVEALLNELRAKYPEGTSFVNGYRKGVMSTDVRGATNNYIFKDSNVPVSITAGCGGWAAFVSDYIFGQTGFPARKVTLSNARPGDIGISVDQDGKLTHVFIVISYPTHDDDAEMTKLYGTDASTEQGGKYAIYWDYGHSQYDDGYGYKLEI